VSAAKEQKSKSSRPPSPAGPRGQTKQVCHCRRALTPIVCARAASPHRCAFARRSCRSAYNDWQVQHAEWDKLPAELHQQNLCRDCYGAALPPERRGWLAKAITPGRQLVHALHSSPALTLVGLLTLLCGFVAVWWAMTMQPASNAA